MNPTPRQMETLTNLFRLGSLKDSARVMGVRDSTLKKHLSEAYRRLGVENAYEAAYQLWLRTAWGEHTPAPLSADQKLDAIRAVLG